MSAKKFLPFRACRSFLKTRKNCAFSETLLQAKNIYEFRHRLKWLSEGSLMFHLSLGTHQAKAVSARLMDEFADTYKKLAQYPFAKASDREKDFYNFLLKLFDAE
jgi:hypothetical protein